MCVYCTIGLVDQIIISRYYPILVLTTLLGHARNSDAKKGAKKYQAPITSRENAIQKYHFAHMFFLIFSLIMT